MNYISLINNFWQVFREAPLPASDTTLYFYLLDTCNRLGWKNPFGHSDRHLSAVIGMNVKTIRKAKLRLVDAGLIELILPDKPSNSIAGQTKYKLLTVVKNTTVDSVTGVKNTTEYGTNIKQNYLYLTDKDKDSYQSAFLSFRKLLDNFPRLTKFDEPLTIEEFAEIHKGTKDNQRILIRALENMDSRKGRDLETAKNSRMYVALKAELRKIWPKPKRTPKPKEKQPLC